VSKVIETGPDNKYIKARANREQCVDAILASRARKKVVVGGPGTGKTHLFKRILKGKQNTLTLTFVRALVEELTLDLCGLSEVRTLHGFAREQLARTKKRLQIFPKLSIVIGEDAFILLNKEIHFDKIFYNMEDDNEHIEFYKSRKGYYDYYGYTDIIYGAVKYFERNKDKIPSYDLVLVDEFQDFNKLEVSLIDLLSKKSPILLVGDDDQALYNFKDAKTDYIRGRYGDPNSHYCSFELPYCSRSTRVIVGAATDFISSARAIGLLQQRIDKRFLYFNDKKKNRESLRYPKIVWSKVFARQIPWYIEIMIQAIAREVKGRFSVLIISPTRNQASTIASALKNKGFRHIQFVERASPNELTLLDGLRLLLDDEQSNLGWRILAKLLLKSKEFELILRKAYENVDKEFMDFLESDFKNNVKLMIKVIRCIKDNKAVNDRELEGVLVAMGFSPYGMEKDHLRGDLILSAGQMLPNGVRTIPITLTTVQGSKGLSSDFVFITNFDDRFFIKHKDKKQISDHDACSFLVSLTRARRKIFLISCDINKVPTFLTWIKKDRIE
jgi:superfamily I DNA/RNA helicase